MLSCAGYCPFSKGPCITLTGLWRRLLQVQFPPGREGYPIEAIGKAVRGCIDPM